MKDIGIGDFGICFGDCPDMCGKRFVIQLSRLFFLVDIKYVPKGITFRAKHTVK